MTERLSVIRHGQEGKSTYEVVVMTHRRPQQEQAAIARDIMTMMRSMRVGEVINIQIERVTDTDGPFRHWRCDGQEMPQGSSFAADEIEAAYSKAFSPPAQMPSIHWTEKLLALISFLGCVAILVFSVRLLCDLWIK